MMLIAVIAVGAEVIVGTLATFPSENIIFYMLTKNFKKIVELKDSYPILVFLSFFSLYFYIECLIIFVQNLDNLNTYYKGL